MGIKRLTTYANSDEMAGAWRRGGAPLRDTRLVVDGGGLLYRLLEVSGPGGQEGDARCGGQYADFHRCTCAFFDELRRHGVSPLVLLDGVGVVQKLDTARERGEQHAQFLRRLAECALDQREVGTGRTVLPVWAPLVFVEAAAACGVAVVRVEREADDVIAAVARHYACPVLTGDSDFFICDLPGGVLHLRKIDYRRPCATPAPLFRRSAFVGTLARQGALRGCAEEQIRDLLPLAATLCGNDYVTQAHVQKLYGAGGGGAAAGSHALVQALRWLLTVLRARTLADGVEKLRDLVPGPVHATIAYSVGTYAQSAARCAEIVARHLSPERLSALLCQDGRAADGAAASDVDGLPACPGRLAEAFHLGFVHPVALSGRLCDLYKVDVHLDSPQHAPISNVDRPLRAVLLALMCSPGASVKELVRCPGGTAMQAVRLQAVRDVAGYGAVPSLAQVAELGREQRRRFFLLACESWTERVRALPPMLQFFAASLRYLWKRMLASGRSMPAVSPRHIAVLLAGFVDGCEGNCKAPLLDVDRALEAQKKRLESWCSGGGDDAGRRAERCEAAAAPGDDDPAPTPCYVGMVSCPAIHVFNAWQRVVLSLVQINWALDLPLPSARLHRLYDGVRSHTLHEDARVRDVLAASPHPQLARTLWMAVSEGLEDGCDAAGAGQSKKRRRQKQQQGRKGAQDSASASAVNRFAGLHLE